MIYSVSPSYVDTAKVAGGITGVLTGVNFTEDMVLTVGGKEVEYTFDSDKQLTFQIPANSIGRVDIALKRGGETAAILTMPSPMRILKVRCRFSAAMSRRGKASGCR